MKEKSMDVYPYREKFLEYVVSLKENADRYQTMLAEVYIDNLFQIQDRSLKDEILLPNLINPRRKKFQQFLEERDNYDPKILLEKVTDSWMFEEEIILLVKGKDFEKAIHIFVDNKMFKEAERFCNERP